MTRPWHEHCKVAPKAARTLNGVVYASKAEMLRADELDGFLRLALVVHVIEQPLVRLGCAENKYHPDFFVVDDAGKFWYEDVKGHETIAFNRWKRLWRAHGPAPLRILMRRGAGWKVEQIEGRTDETETD